MTRHSQQTPSGQEQNARWGLLLGELWQSPARTALSSVRLQLGYGLGRLRSASPQKSAPSGTLWWCEEELKSSGTVMAQVGLGVQLITA